MLISRDEYFSIENKSKTSGQSQSQNLRQENKIIHFKGILYPYFLDSWVVKILRCVRGLPHHLLLYSVNCVLNLDLL